MRNFILLNVFFIFFVQSSLSLAAKNDLHVTYFETNEFPLDIFKTNDIQALTNERLIIKKINLDSLKNMEKAMSQDLPDTEKAAEKIVLERIDSLTEEDHRQMSESIKGHFMLVKWKIKKLPAFVFNDGSSVIYGLTNLNEALNIYREHQRSNN